MRISVGQFSPTGVVAENLATIRSLAERAVDDDAELLVLPEYQGQGVGSCLLRLAREHTPTLLYFGAQPGQEGFYEKNGCRRSLPSYQFEPV